MQKQAYSYARFSTPRQTYGTSLERQLKIAREWYVQEIAPLGTPLAEIACDEGLSAWKGEHVEQGSLGHFLAEIKSGSVAPDSILIAENLDRISRQGPKIAHKLLERIVDNGVSVHIVNINAKLTLGWENDLSKSVIVDSELSRAWRESVYKSERLTEGWKSKRKRASSTNALTSIVPGWLRATTGGKIEIIPERAETIRKIYTLAAMGLGAERIATRLIADGDKPFTIEGDKRFKGRWALSSIRRFLSSRAAIGELTTTKGEILSDYYPPVVSHAEYEAARAAIESRLAIDPSKFRGSRAKGGNRFSDVAANLFSGIVFDVTEGRSMNYKTDTYRAYLVTSFLQVGAKCNRIRYDQFEIEFLKFLSGVVDWKAVAGASESEEAKDASNELNEVLGELDRTTRLTASLNTAMDDPEANLAVLSKKLGQAEIKVAELIKQKEALSAKVESARASCAALYDSETVKQLIAANGPEANDIRLRLRTEIRRRIGRIELDFSGELFPIVVNVQFVNAFTLKGVAAFGNVSDKPAETRIPFDPNVG